MKVRLADALSEVSHGVGLDWKRYRLLGATRDGVAPAKEGVGKAPERYKLVDAGTIFYNPMRILIGSIAMVDDGEEPGITSPDYVVFKTKPGVLHHRCFYHWLRSPAGEAFIKTLARGAVRERMLFRRLAPAELNLPPWGDQLKLAQQLAAVDCARAAAEAQLKAGGTLLAITCELGDTWSWWSSPTPARVATGSLPPTALADLSEVPPNGPEVDLPL